MSSRAARSYAFLSIAAAIVTIALKLGAYMLTQSVGLLSDAIESCVNLVTALVALWALTYAAKPADVEHAFGYSKAEYFSSGAEGALIVVAAILIAIETWGRLLHPEPLTQLGLGLALSLSATVSCCALNLYMGRGQDARTTIILRFRLIQSSCTSA